MSGPHDDAIGLDFALGAPFSDVSMAACFKGNDERQDAWRQNWVFAEPSDGTLLIAWKAHIILVSGHGVMDAAVKARASVPAGMI